MNMFARFDKNPAMILQDIKETKLYGRTDGRTEGQLENSIPTTNKVCGGYKNKKKVNWSFSELFFLQPFFFFFNISRKPPSKTSKVNLQSVLNL